MAKEKPYEKWMTEQPLRLDEWVKESGATAAAHPAREVRIY